MISALFGIWLAISTLVSGTAQKAEDSNRREYEWKWFGTDQPSHIPPERVHGGIQ